MLAKVVFVALLACAVAMGADVEAAGEAEAAVATTTEQQTEQQTQVDAAAEGEAEAEAEAETETEESSEAEAEAETETEGEAEADAEAEAKPTGEKKVVKPHMHPRGGLRRGHVKPYPVGYNARRWRAPRYSGGGRAPTTEQLLFPYRHHADTRKEIVVKGEAAGPYPWETPEYEAEYVDRTGNSARNPVPRKGAKSIPVVHYQRGSHSMRPRRASRASLRHHGKPRRANTPRPSRRQRIPGRPRRHRRGGRRGRRVAHRRGGRRAGRRVGPRRGRKAGSRKGKKAAARKGKGKKAGGKKAAGAKGKKQMSLEDKVTRLEKTMTFALRELGRHLGRMRKLEKFAKKGKTAITLIAKALQKNQGRARGNKGQVAALVAAQKRTDAKFANLHARSKAMNKLVKKHKQAIATIAKEFQKSRRARRAQVAANAKHISTLKKNTAEMMAAQRAAILVNDKRAKADERQVAANQLNTAALHKAATNAQAAILNLDKRLKATTKLANKEKKAFKLVFSLLNAQKSEISQVKNHAVAATRKGTGH